MTTEMTTTSNKLTAAQREDNDLKAYLMGAVTSLKGVANKYMDPERLVRIALVARARTPMLMKCSKESILMSLMQAAEMGLEPNTPLQHAALVPRRNNKTGGYECQYMPMYRGLIELGRRSGIMRTCRAVPVYSCDEYSITEGLVHTIEHKPSFEHADFGDPSKVVLVYAVAQLTGGDTEWTYMTSAQVKRIQHRSPAGKDGPWQTDWEEMAKKTVIRRLFKLLPLTIDVAKAVEAGADEDEREGVDLSLVAAAASAVADAEEAGKVVEISQGAAGELEAPKSGGDELAEAITKSRAKDAVRADKKKPEDVGPQGNLV